MPLTLHRAERADRLLDVLAARTGAADPFAPEVVAVPTRGVERWVTQQLAQRHGVCANVRFPSPRAIADEAVAAASGLDPREDPWRPERAAWPLAELIAAHAHEPWLATLRRHLDGAADPDGRRLGVARRLAARFDRYGRHRPEVVLAWMAGRLVDEAGAPLPADLAWQARLWRLLHERLGDPPAARTAAACERLVAEPELLDLPARLALWGLTRLPAADLRVLQAIAERREVDALLLHPSPALWDALAGRPPVRRRAAAADLTARHPLLASWGRDVRELQLVLGAPAEHHAVAIEGDTLLARLQREVQRDRPPAAPEPLAPGDRSVQVHACHGRARQVEVLRDVVLGLLADDPTLEPRDVLVMCPDIEDVAPLVSATFGTGAEDDERPDLRVRLADRAVRQTNPVLGTVGALLELVAGRVPASAVLDLADRDPVRRRFGFDDDDLGRLERWVAGTGVRWAIEAGHRAPFGLDEVADGTWRVGLDRVLLAAALAEEGHALWRGVLPLDDVDSGAIDLAGRFAELVDRLAAAREALTRTQPVAAWAAAIADAADGLTATAPRDAWQRAELHRVLDDLVREAEGTGLAVTPAEVRELLADRLAGRPTRANFRTGAMTVCTLLPMRSVPHRVVCLLGLDDGAFPRAPARDGDDLLLRDPCVGERDPRSEDRQLLLDALMATTQTLVVLFTGNDERTNATRPPAVPVIELLDAIGQTASTAASPAVVTRHPLQPFDARNFTAPPRSFDRRMRDGAAARGTEAPPLGLRLGAPLPALRQDLVALDDLVAFVQHPVKAFLRQRLGVRVSDLPDEVADELELEPGGLAKWGIGDRLLRAVLAGAEPLAALAAEQARGSLPPAGTLQEAVVDEVGRCVTAVHERARAVLPGGPATTVDVDVDLGGGRRLVGTVGGVCGDVVQSVSYATLRGKHRLAAWVRLLALAAAGRPVTGAVTVGRERDDAAVSRFAAPPDPLAHLLALVALRDRGLCEPLPLPCEAASRFAAAGDPVAGRRRAEGAWRSDWVNGTFIEREDVEPEHVLAFGGRLTFEELWQRSPRFEDLALELWEGARAWER
jgi:exodeoxyribonuclease V gamma subunit